MPSLNISKVAVGCRTLEALQKRQVLRLADGVVPLITRFMPKRAEELVGGSVYWIVKHRITARQTILALATRPEDRRTVISLCPELVPVKALPRRAHQGWRYLAGEDAPPDYDGTEDGLAALPHALAGKLASLALI